ncbi:hypothetical protein D3C85_159790 [compost metagenome]
MSKNNVVSIKAHPKYRDVAELRRYLAEMYDSGTKMEMPHVLDLNAPELQEQLFELNAWAEALQGLTPISMSDPNATPMKFSDEVEVVYTGSNLGKSRSLTDIIPKLGGKEYWEGGLRKGDFYNFGAVESPLLEAFPIRSLPGRGEMFENRIYLNNEFVKKEPNDANPST